MENDKPNRGGPEDKGGRSVPRKGWDILMRVIDRQSRDNLSIVGAGVAFYWFLALFPALAAAVSIYGLIANPHRLQHQIDSLSAVMPPQAYQIIRSQLTTMMQHPGRALSWGLIIGIFLTIWSANKGMKALMTALNIVYDEKETRSYIKQNAFSLLLTFCLIVLGLIAITLVIAVPAVIERLDLPAIIQVIFTYARWPLLGIFLILALAVAYRFCPDRHSSVRWRWISPGSVAATLLWLLVSVLFSVYVAHFGSYGKIYGSMGAVIILLMWFFLTAYVILLGGELNQEMEHRKKKNSGNSG